MTPIPRLKYAAAVGLCWATAWSCSQAQSGPKATAAGVHTIYIESADHSRTSAAVDERLLQRIQKSGTLRVVRDKAMADAVLHVTAVVWPEGTYVANPHSRTASVSTYRGYASADLVGRDADPLWSYLATPKGLGTTSVTSRLGDQLFDQLRLAVGRGVFATNQGKAPSQPVATALRIAGATFPAPLYRKWFESYAEHSGGTPIRYDATGSVAGMAMLQAGKIDVAASDIPAVDGDDGFAASLVRVPTVIGGVVPIVNLPGTSGTLRLTPEVLAGIYAGTVKRWNDPAVRLWNKDLHLPDAAIEVVHRSDGSGTSFVWTSFLARSSDAWKGKAGATADWPVGVGELGNEGVAAEVQTTPNAIGYVELTYAIQHRLSYASVRNPAGQFVRADLDSLAAAAQSALAAGDATDGPLLDEPGAGSYPIATFTYFLFPHRASNTGDANTTVDLLRWVLVEGQKQCASLGYAPLPRETAAREMAKVEALKQ